MLNYVAHDGHMGGPVKYLIQHPEPIGIARAADILRLRRWVLEEEGHKSGQPAGERSTVGSRE